MTEIRERTIPFGKPVMGPEEYQGVKEVMDSGLLVHGPRIKAFEAAFGAFTKAESAIGLSSCTAGLHLAYFALGIGPGDEVIVPAQTHTATAHAVELVGARPVFVDAELKTGNMDLDAIEAAITDNTKAISIVHFLGMPIDMARVCQIADQHDLKVIEDCALAVGATIDGTHVGLFGTAGCFSFYPVKHMTSAEGGMLITRDRELGEKITLQRAFGVDRHQGERKIPGMYDVIALGYNYRMSELHAAIGEAQMKRVPQFLVRRKENFEALNEALSDIDEIDLFDTKSERLLNSHYCLSVVLQDVIAASRIDIINALKARGVGTSIYYPQPVPHMTYYREKYGLSKEEYPNAARISYQSIALPVGPHVDKDDVQFIAEQLKDVLCRQTK